MVQAAVPSTHPARWLLAVSLAASVLLPGCGKKAPPERPLEPAYPVPHGLAVLQSGEDVVLTWTLSRARGEAREVLVGDCVVESLRLDPASSEDWGANLARIVEAVGRGGMEPAGRVAVGLRSDSLGDRSWSFVDAGAAAAVGMESVYRVVCQTDAKGRGASSAVVWLRAGKAPAAPAALEAVPGPDGIRLAARPTEGTPEDAAWRFYRLELTPGVELTGPGRPLTPQPSAAPVLLDSSARLGADYEYCASAVVRFGSSVRMLLRESEGPSEPLEALALRSPASLPPPSALEAESPLAPPVRLEFRDRFAPERPSGLRALVEGSRVVLLWNPNEEPDLAGYRVFRKEEPSGEWNPLTGELLGEAAYRDDQTRPGAAYSYAVSAVDRADPRNESPRTDPVSVILPVR